MISARLFEPSDWDGARLVAFDVDGTLYDQRRLRLRMAREILVHTAKTWSLDAITVVGAYRKIRERLGDEETPAFDGVLVAETAQKTSRSPDQIRALVGEWIETRPLPYLADCRYPALVELFAALKRRGKIVGILSDYPVAAKLSALGLVADHAVCASDPGVERLKPHPRGMQALMEAAGTAPHETVLIGDRGERDGMAAERAGAAALIRTSKPEPASRWRTFARFDDPIFEPLLRA